MALDISEIKDMVKSDIQALSKSRTTLDDLAEEAVKKNDPEGYLSVLHYLITNGNQMDEIRSSSNYLDIGISLMILASYDIPELEHYKRILVLLSFYALWQHFAFGDMLEKAMAAPQLIRLIHDNTYVFQTLIKADGALPQIVLVLAQWPLTLYDRYEFLLNEYDLKIIEEARAECGTDAVDDDDADHLIDILKNISYGILTKLK